MARVSSFLLVAGAMAAEATYQGPCDIYKVHGTACMAAHSTVRALYSAYNGPLYQVQRTSDNKTKDIHVLTQGGFADSAAQDAFCMSSACAINRVYDQTPQHNHLEVGPAGGEVHRPDKGVNATRLSLSVGGHRVYGAYFEGGMGYRNDKTSGIATADDPETIYMVVGGRHYNPACCFDYGNAEVDNNDDGAGTMEAVYFGSWNASRSGWSGGVGAGPWVMADLEDGLWAGKQAPYNVQNTPIEADFVTAMVKGGPNQFALKGANAQSGGLKRFYEGQRPSAYKKINKQGAIVLGIGGDNSNGAVGTFFEGVITQGYSSDSADDAVQANIVSAGYGTEGSVIV